MRFALAVLVVFALPVSAQSGPSLSTYIAAFEEAMDNPPYPTEVTRQGGGLLVSTEQCDISIPIGPNTRVEVTESRPPRSYKFAVYAEGIHSECTSFRQTKDHTIFRLEQRSHRDAAVEALRAIIQRWPSGGSQPIADDRSPRPPSPPAERGFEERISGTITSSDRLWDDGRRFDEHTIRVPAGARLVADLRSSAFDTYLYVRSPSGDESSNDDWGGSTAHSRVEIDDPAPGTWTFTVTSYDAGETGAYTLDLRTEEAPPPPSPAPDDPDPSEREVLGGDFTVALNQLIAAAPSFDAVKGTLLQTSPHRAYELRVSPPDAKHAFVQCPASRCEAFLLINSFADHRDAGNSYGGLTGVLAVIVSQLEGGPYRYEEQNLDIGLGIDFVSASGLRLKARLADTLDTSPGAERYLVVLQIVP